MTRIILTALLCVLSFPFEAYADGNLPRLRVEGNKIMQENGKDISLRGVSLCSLEWHKPLEQIYQVTDSPFKWNVNILRLPVQVKEWNRVGAQSYIKNYLDPAIEMCSRKNVYCIIDWHRIGRWDDEKTGKSLSEFWDLVAPRYADNPNIIYEFFNEPTEPKSRNPENWNAWKDKAQEWVALIRRHAPDTLILAGSPHWSQMPSFAAKAPFNDKNIAYVMHLYPNFKKSQWDSLFGDAAKSIPIFLTEWGWSSQETAKGNVIYGTQEGFGQPLKDYLRDKPNIGWTAWSYDPKCGPAMLGDDKDMAKFVQEWLSESR